MSFKELFSRSLSADESRLHFASHSHHLWPDASYEGQVDAWNDAARLADRKWEKVMDEVWPEAQRNVAREIGTNRPEAVVFACNTHDFLIRLWSAAPRRYGRALRVLTSGGEFHSARRQFSRWAESGDIVMEEIDPEPFDSFGARFLASAQRGQHDLILASQLLFGSGRLLDRVPELASLGRPEGPWVVIDGYHAFMAIEQPLGEAAGQSAFYLGGGYKYAMAGEGCAFMHAPPGFGPRPPITGWFAEFEDLSLAPGRVGYAKDASRFLGATFDPSALYRFNAVQRMLSTNALSTGQISRHVLALQQRFLQEASTTCLSTAALLNPLDGNPHARFLALRSPNSHRWYSALRAANCITDVRGDVLRIGFGIYQDEADVDRLLQLLRAMS